MPTWLLLLIGLLEQAGPLVLTATGDARAIADAHGTTAHLEAAAQAAQDLAKVLTDVITTAQP